MKEVNIALLGFGTVGKGVYELLEKNAPLIYQKTGLYPRIKKILVRDLNKIREKNVPSNLFTLNIEEILEDDSLPVVCELIGGINPAKEYVLRSLQKGKHVITANKAILAEFGDEIWKEASQQKSYLGFEASVGGGIPIIKTLKEALIGNKIKSIVGIVNGTTNYILTRMLENNLSFKEALKEAQAKGYAEADPSLDIKGWDSAHKISILASLAFGTYISFSKVYVEGIEEIDLLDLKFAKDFGYVIKLLAFAQKDKNRLEIRVHPTLIPENHVLASVRLNYNAFYITGDFVGDILLYGLGAGKEPTASAVVSDIVSAMEYTNLKREPFIKYPSMDKSLEKFLKPIEEVEFKYYIRFSAMDKPGVLSKISGILGKYEISIASVVQIGRQKKKGSVPIVMLTHESKEKNLRKALKEIDQLEVVTAITKKIRIWD
ncbi:MAG: homoserine dehydrogenase [Thermodesulfobacteriaceae bacterium]|nr:homoserine dehydrogenase [Thermodesulfobacteriaceae bacterium]MCX8041783.1 homoserine dehydrogenase [Thermodesulfobacteriaceae bacterium]MDW8135208.1 homoserine dehydrogenase [Thermodesulfobacterium sp.]